MASAHFMVASRAVGAAANPAIVHDFSGLPRELYDIQYAAAGDPAPVAEVAGRLADAGFMPDVSATHGIDHEVWVPLRRM